MEEQIARCERAVQMPLENGLLLQPTLKEQARFFQQCLLRTLFGLKDNAAMITVEVASAHPIPLPVVDVLGSLITQPAGGSHFSNEDGIRSYLAGGYEVIDRSRELKSIEAFRRLDLTWNPHPLSPPGAERLLYLFDAVEAATVFTLPPTTLETPPGLNVQSWRTQSAPRELPKRVVSSV